MWSMAGVLVVMVYNPPHPSSQQTSIQPAGWVSGLPTNRSFVKSLLIIMANIFHSFSNVSIVVEVMNNSNSKSNISRKKQQHDNKVLIFLDYKFKTVMRKTLVGAQCRETATTNVKNLTKACKSY